MKHFRHKPSHRREPRPTAAQIILGPLNARAAARGDVTLHIAPVTNRDHRKRYSPGARLAVRPSVGAPTTCHVHITDVRGPADTMTLSQLTFDDARAAGHKTTLNLRRAWLLKHDAAWTHRQTADGGGQAETAADIPEEDIDARWERHTRKPVWAVRFVVDIAGSDRYLAARSDELYVENPARALPDEPPALSETDFQRHVADRAGMHTAQYIALEHATRDADIEAQTLGQQLDAAIAHARRSGQTIPRDVRIIEQRLASLQRRVYRRAA